MTESEWQTSPDGESMLTALGGLVPVSKLWKVALAVDCDLTEDQLRTAITERFFRESLAEVFNPLAESEPRTTDVPAVTVMRWLREHILVSHGGAALADALREQLGNPFRPCRFDPKWRTETVLALAAGIEAERAFDRMPILADALEEAGCDHRPLLDHLRVPGPHAPGCWALDLTLDREPELFALPALEPFPRPPTMRLGPYTPPPENLA